MVTFNIDISKEVNQAIEAEDYYIEENPPAEIVPRLGALIDPTIEGAVRDYVGQWYLNSRVLHGRFFGRLKELATYLSETTGFEVLEEDIVLYRREMQKMVQKNLSDVDKVVLIQEQLSLILQQASTDRGKSVAVQDTLMTALEGMTRGQTPKDLAYIFTSYKGRALLQSLQAQQKLTQDSNEKTLAVLEKMVGFGTTRESGESLNSILNASNKDKKPMNNQDILQLLEDQEASPLPTEAKQLNISYDDYIKGESNDQGTTVTISQKIPVRESEPETQPDYIDSRSVEIDSDFPD